MDLSELREQYETAGLRRADLDPDPIVQFDRWYGESWDAGVWEAHAGVLSTVDAHGWPDGRTVLLRDHDERGFVFYTNYRSVKGLALDATGRAALTFHWGELRRKVRLAGTVQRVADAQSDAYFASRPRGSQVGAWASDQSEIIADRAALDERERIEEVRWEGRDVERPPHWGGYRLAPERIEFWQGRPDRLHDRFRYGRTADGWECDRLAP